MTENRQKAMLIILVALLFLSVIMACGVSGSYSDIPPGTIEALEDAAERRPTATAVPIEDLPLPSE